MRCDGTRCARTESAWTQCAWRTMVRRAGLVVGAALVTGVGPAACGGSGDHARDRAAGRPPNAAGGPAADTTTVTVYKSPTCGCCAKWVDHMRASGFRVVVHDTADVASVRARHGVSGLLAACHTALVGGYVVEGHVPAADVRRLLRERPDVAGLAVPGMPMGAPGMEGPYRSDRYQVLAFDRDGGGGVFARH